MRTRIGVDVGGTFTDLVLVRRRDRRDRRRQGSRRRPTRRERGVLAAVEAALAGRRVGALALLPARHDRRPERAARAARRRRRPARDPRLPRRARGAPRRPRRPLRPVLAAAGAARPAPPARDRSPSGCWPTARSTAPIDLAERAPRRSRRFAADGVDAVAVALLNAYANPARTSSRRERAAARLGLRRRDLALAPRLGRVPRVRAHLHDRDRRLRPPPHGPLPRAARGRARRAAASSASRWSPAPAAAR